LARKTTDDVRIDVIRNGVDVSFFEPGEPPGLFTILFVGRLIERKGLIYLLEAFAALRRREPGARLLLAGEGPQRDALERHCRQAGLESSVRFLGQVERSSLPATYREASVFALPSLEEAMPNAVLEAMAAGLPIIATRTGAIELIDGNGILVDRASSESLERAFEQYLRSPELLRSHAKRSRELAETLSWGNVARAYREVYARVLRGPAS
jgi:glycosyltransferase involved in cell wall biosynthesis